MSEKHDDIIRQFAQFGAWVLDQHRENECSDMDGGDLQDKAIELKLLVYEKRKEPCSTDGACWCASYFQADEWPVDCLRLAPGVREAVNRLMQNGEKEAS